MPVTINKSLLDKALAELCRRDFYRFVIEFWNTIIPDEPVYNWHIEYLCNELQTVAENTIANNPKMYDLIINIPPGTTKSTICTIMFPVWCWTRAEWLRFIAGSYSADLSLEHAVKSRDIIRSDKFKALFPHIQIRRDRDNKGSYSNVQNGNRTSTSVGGTITGKHAHIIIIDDPLNPKQAASPVKLKTANDWMDSTLSSRKVDKALTPTILIMQRLHEDDCTGHIIAKGKDKIKHICLPAEDGPNVKPSDLRLRYKDGLLDPVRLRPEIIKEAKIDLGTYGYAGQYEQNPVPLDGGLVDINWFQRYNAAPAGNDVVQIVQFWDTASKGDELLNCPWVCGTWIQTYTGYYLIDVFRDWMDYPSGKRAAINLYNKFVPNAIVIEDKSTGQSLIQELSGLPCVPFEPDTDKITRFVTETPLIESGQVYLPKDAPWLFDFEQEIQHFPNGKYIDQVDMVSMALRYFRTKSNQWSGSFGLGQTAASAGDY